MTEYDCELMPRLHHIRIVGAALCEFNIGQHMTHLWNYMLTAYRTAAFVESCPADQDIIHHYKVLYFTYIIIYIIIIVIIIIYIIGAVESGVQAAWSTSNAHQDAYNSRGCLKWSETFEIGPVIVVIVIILYD